MSGDPVVSVIIPCYQSARTVGAAISSALTQTYPRVEVVVVDDGSSDASAAVLAGYGDLIRVITQPNAGVSAARNRAVEAASGELIATLDADDILLPGHVAAAVDAWQAAGGGRRFVTCEAYVLGPEGIFPGRRVLPAGAVPPAAQRRAILERNIVSIMSLFPAAMHHELGGFDTSLTHCEDYDFWARAVFSGWEIVFQAHPHALYRRAAGSASRASEKILAGLEKVRRNLYEQHGAELSGEERELLELTLTHGPGEAHVAAGESALASGDRERARDEFALASRLSPGDRRLRLKARLLRVPGLAGELSRRQAARYRQTGD